MLSKKEIKDIQSLSLKKQRDETGLFIAEGPKIVGEMVQHFPEQIERIYGLASWAAAVLLTQKLKTTIVTEAELQRISQLQSPNMVVAVLKQFERKEPNAFSWAIYLDAIQDPGNLGTIIRIADWFGVQAIVCGPGCADVYNPKVVQSTMASIGRVNFFYDDNGGWLLKQTLPIIAATLGGRLLSKYNKMEKGILLIGNESKGLSKELIAMASHQITIDKRGQAESLNAAVATGIILSHLVP